VIRLELNWLIDCLRLYVPLKKFSLIWRRHELQNLGLCSALRAFEQGGIFIAPRLLWHRASVSPVSSEGPSHSLASYDTQGDVRGRHVTSFGQSQYVILWVLSVRCITCESSANKRCWIVYCNLASVRLRSGTPTPWIQQLQYQFPLQSCRSFLSHTPLRWAIFKIFEETSKIIFQRSVRFKVIVLS
jgi:hypothetical protein